MELSQETKNKLINNKLAELKVKEYQLYLDRVAHAATGEEQGVIALDKRITAVQAAYKAIEGELIHADAKPTDTGRRSESAADS